MTTIEEIIGNKYIVVESGEHVGEILEVFTATDSGDFLDCKNNNDERRKIQRSIVRLATKEEIYKFQRLLE